MAAVLMFMLATHEQDTSRATVVTQFRLGGLTQSNAKGGDKKASLSIPQDSTQQRGALGMTGLVKTTSPALLRTKIQTGVVVVTASSSNHYCPMQKFLVNIAEMAPTARVVVYLLDMVPTGLTLQMVQRHNPNIVALRQFNFSRYPPHFNMSLGAGSYAWKPVLIKECLDEFGSVLWVDAGNQFYQDPLQDIEEALETTGFISGRTEGNFLQWTHPGMLRYFQLADKPAVLQQYNHNFNCNGAIIAFKRDSKAYKDLLEPWYHCALDKACIAPPGSSRDNHRQDQAALTTLVNMHGYSCRKSARGIGRHADHIRGPCEDTWGGAITQEMNNLQQHFLDKHARIQALKSARRMRAAASAVLEKKS